jgi:signal transduction histidine kinase
VNNAVKFTEEGSVTVTVRQINGAVEFRVQDTGIGIPSDSLTTIFDMFQQADSSKTRTYGGAGVGLFIVKKFTEALNGQIQVESVVGRGTTFTLNLPMATNHDCRNLPILDSITVDTPLDPSEPVSTLSV